MAEPRTFANRWLVWCKCGQRTLVASRADAIIQSCRRCATCHQFAGRVHTFARIEYRAPRGRATSCRLPERRGEPRTVGSFDRVPPGRCAWDCLNSLAAVCRCTLCKGEHHGANMVTTVVMRETPETRAALAALYEGIEGAAPRGDWPGRKST